MSEDGDAVPFLTAASEPFGATPRAVLPSRLQRNSAQEALLREVHVRPGKRSVTCLRVKARIRSISWLGEATARFAGHKPGLCHRPPPAP